MHLKYRHFLTPLLAVVFMECDFVHQLVQRFREGHVGLIADCLGLCLLLLCCIIAIMFRNTYWTVHLFYCVACWLICDLIVIYAFHPGLYTSTHLFSELSLAVFFLGYPRLLRFETRRLYMKKKQDMQKGEGDREV